MPPKTGRRRSPRIAEERPIEVTGTTVDGVDFLAQSRTVLLSRYGAKIHLDQALALEQEISIYHPESKRECLAKVVGLYDRESGGYSYGIEFLDPKLDFWNLGFPVAAEPGAVETQAKTASVASPSGRKAPPPAAKAHPAASEERPRSVSRTSARTPAGNDYAVQMKCPHGGEEQWVLLRNREEALQQILNTAWDFPCPIHGLQRELPLQVREVQEWLQSEAERKGPETFPRGGSPPVEAQLRKQRQSETRSPQAVRVWVSGQDPHGNPFSQSAYSLDISRRGARLDGVGFLITPGMTVEVKRGWKKAQFRVVWVGEIGTHRAGQVGIRCLEPEKNIWGLR
ncbi:MAG: hypothetical protein ACRD88_09305 [Terriglobia bacterium]